MTKGDALKDRMQHAFGNDRVLRSFQNMISASGCDLIDYLTDEARDELIRRCITSHRLQRKYAAESRRHYQEKQNGLR